MVKVVDNEDGKVHPEPLGATEKRDSVFELEDVAALQKEAIELTPAKAQLVKDFKLAGNQLFQVEKYEEAIEKYSQAIEIDPSNERLYSNRAAAYIAMENWQGAIKDAEFAIELNPDFAKAFTRLGTALKGAGLWKKAEEAYGKVLAFLADEDADWDKIQAEIRVCAEQITEHYQKDDGTMETDHEEEQLQKLKQRPIDVKKDPDAEEEEEEESSSGPPEMKFPEKYRPGIMEFEYWRVMFTNPGNISNMIGMAIMISGFAVWIATDKKNKTGYYLRSIGLQAFAGGLTNWIAIQMLWNKIPYLAGTGIILEKYDEIRDALKETVMTTFFDETYLNWYVKDKLLSINYVEVTKTLVNKHNAHEIILEAAVKDPNLRALVGPSLKPLIVKTVMKMEPQIKGAIKKVNLVQQLSSARKQIDDMLEGKLQIMTPPRVKSLMEDLIASELYWLIVWGNIFGGGLGLIGAILFVEAGLG